MKIDTAVPPNLSSDVQHRIEKIYDHLYANSFTKTPAKIATEVGKILHVAMFMEEMEGVIPAFNFSKSDHRDFFQINQTSQKKMAQEIHSKFQVMNSKWKLYAVKEKINLSDFDLYYTCSQLGGLTISDSTRDVFGDALEIFRCQWSKRIGGQFFTDQRVTALAMALLKFDPRDGDDLVDICSGTGGFLLAGLNRIRELLEKSNHSAGNLESELVSLALKALHGQEVDKEVCEIANSTLRSRLGTVGNELVSNGDSFSPEAFTSKARFLQLGKHLCAASNPPFGTTITVKDPRVLVQFELAKHANRKGLVPRAPDILFLERNIQMLKPGVGRLAIVLPYQLLSGPKTLFVREWLLRHTQILSVVDLPSETFQPHTGTKTSLLVVKRRKEPLIDVKNEKDHEIFMSMPRWIGHDRRGKPVYEKTPEGKQSGKILTDFDDMKKAFRLYEEGKDPRVAHKISFKIKYSEILNDPLLRMNALYHQSNKQIANTSSRLVKDEWKVVKLGEVVKKIFYPGRFKRNYVDHYRGAIPFLGGSNITELNAKFNKWLSPDDPKLEELKVCAGWILITRSGTTGIISSVPHAWDGFAMSEHVIRIVPNDEKIDRNYLLAFLRTKYGQEQLARGVFGSVIDEITPEHIAELNILIPKSKKAYLKIAESVKIAEDARQVAIHNLMDAVSALNEQLSA